MQSIKILGVVGVLGRSLYIDMNGSLVKSRLIRGNTENESDNNGNRFGIEYCN